MPATKFLMKYKIDESFRNKKITSMFDFLEKEVINEYDINLPIEDKKWNIGLIVGPSGSGKTITGKKLFPDYKTIDDIEWDNDKSIIDCFPQKFSVNQITDILTRIGFNSPPQWLKPFRILSNGQQFRINMARVLLENNEPIIIDEFTSVIDRENAKICSDSIQKYIRNNQKKMIFLSCHYDIIDWLQPDWILDMKDQSCNWRSVRRRPEIECKIRKAHYSEWQLFKDHHYMNNKINKASICFIIEINNKQVGFMAWLAQPTCNFKCGYYIRGHRRVVLPEYQNLGIGRLLAEYTAQIFADQNKVVQIATKSFTAIKSLQKSNKWKLINVGFDISPNRKHLHMNKSKVRNIKKCTFLYIPDKLEDN